MYRNCWSVKKHNILLDGQSQREKYQQQQQQHWFVRCYKTLRFFILYLNVCIVFDFRFVLCMHLYRIVLFVILCH